MAIKQLSVFVENKKGTLVEITEAISNAGVDIRAMLLADTQDFGILRLVVSDAEKAAAALKNANCMVTINDVVAVCVGDTAGNLSQVVRLMTDNGIDIEYMYAFITISKQYAYVVFRVEDNDYVSKLLEDNGVKLVTQEDIDNL